MSFIWSQFSWILDLKVVVSYPPFFSGWWWKFDFVATVWHHVTRWRHCGRDSNPWLPASTNQSSRGKCHWPISRLWAKFSTSYVHSLLTSLWGVQSVVLQGFRCFEKWLDESGTFSLPHPNIWPCFGWISFKRICYCLIWTWLIEVIEWFSPWQQGGAPADPCDPECRKYWVETGWMSDRRIDECCII